MVTALYRRYRPETFAELIGQAQVTDPLRTALRTDRVGHAYLFSGPRGCGKTTSARILARCLNCAEGPTDTPCGTCASCVELARDGGGSLDVIEIDAASHNGVDDARDLRDRAAFAPARDRYKIFILDEAHMVTPQGFNALLKLVEEPPEHVKFIFATTEPEKVIGTIRSRTHHYPFRLVPPATMLEYVQHLCTEEGIEVEGGVLPLVVRAGGGSVRDTLSLLDQLIAGSEDSTVRYERAVALLGYTHGALLDEIVDALAARDAQGVFEGVDRVIQTGQDPRRFVDDLLERLRDLIVVAATRDQAGAVLRGVPADEIERMTHQATAYGTVELSRAADVVNSALTEMTGATSPRLHLELMAARLLVPASDETERGTLARVERLERRIGIEEADAAPAPERPSPQRPAPASAPPVASTPSPTSTPTSTPTPTPSRVVEEPAPQAVEERPAQPAPAVEDRPAQADAPRGSASAPVSLQQLRDAWPEILEIVQGIKRGSWMVVYTSTPRAYDAANEVLTLSFPSDNDVQSFRQAQGAGESVSEHLRQAIVKVLGVRVKFIARVEGGAPAAAPAPEPAPAVPASGWNVTPIAGATPAATPVDDEVPPPADEEPPPPDDEPEPTPAASTSQQPADPPAGTAVGAGAAAKAGNGMGPEAKRAPNRPGRYGEAVVREVLKASFIEEVQLNPRDRPVRLVEEPASGAPSTEGGA
ncbi:DNA polymerase III subunit gamma and tau [Protaetiibacter mangrovi]|uniref:DNA polymerase III subunit gamma/tau n=1 Tax=Protaetiibacter mangrovi TaxID=2970926 RepID=A0ABT1ZFV7_9MICO|nr:DNA polymerase III subunit gamma and tau [Protaetiibacter mangrovi]MCS0499599.1 DNA polymerase III subunit gamma and tau [Protaetiibacter mangrovi]TPX02840.1 DNA polymerase III subunit gamma and tau [Schumannella luteola]